MYKNALFLCAGVAAIAPAFAASEAAQTVDYARTEAALIKDLGAQKNITPENAPALYKAMVLEFIRETGADVLNAFAADADRAAFLRAFTGDKEWLEMYLCAGLVPHHTDVGIGVLYNIWKDQNGKVKNKALATALASAWGGGETAPNPAILTKNPARFNPVWRYNFFEKQAAEGRLHPNYKNLRPWELRFVVGIPGQDWDDLSYKWAAENINIPWDKYNAACWAATYTDPSKFGDDVQSGFYNLPFSELSDAETTHRNGGVCGALSHLGTVATMAHGIPAYTCGQPGHCAYAVRTERGKWVGGFGGPDGSMHNHIFGNQAPTSYLLMEEVFKDDAAVAKAYRLSFCARAQEAVGDLAGAEATWKKALKHTPLHPFFRAQLHRLMLAQGLTPAGCYDYLVKTIPLYKGNGFSAVNMANDLKPLIDKLDDKHKLDIYTAMHHMIAGTPSSWATKCDDMIKAQAGSLSGDAAREAYLGAALAEHINSEDGTVFGQMLEWCVENLVKNGQSDVFARAFSKAAGASKAVDTSAPDAEKRLKSVSNAYGKAIIATEQARSAAAFSVLSDAAAKVLGAYEGAGALTRTSEMTGKPAKGVLFRISTTCTWDTPAWHGGIMTPTGGKCHTAKEKNPEFIVEIEKAGTLTGCLIRKSAGYEERMRHAVVYTSADGATWMKRAETADMPKEWAVSFPAGTVGKWVKLEFQNEGEGNFAHLSHFVIYTK